MKIASICYNIITTATSTAMSSTWSHILSWMVVLLLGYLFGMRSNLETLKSLVLYLEVECFRLTNDLRGWKFILKICSSSLCFYVCKLVTLEWLSNFASGEPLVFIEVALLKNVAQTVQVSFLLSSLTLFHRWCIINKFCCPIGSFVG